MATTLKTKKVKGRSQNKIYEHRENIYPQGRKEPVATKEFVRQELRAELEPIKRDMKWLMVILASLVGIMIYLHGDTKADIRRVEAKLDTLIQGKATAYRPGSAK